MDKNIEIEEPFLLYQSHNRLERSLFFQVILAQRVTTSLLEDFINNRKIPLRIGQLFVFMGICNLGIATQKEIADFVLRDKASIQRTVTDFVRNNLVKCYSDRNDKRKIQVSLTEKGERIAREIFSFIKEMEGPYIDRIRSLTIPEHNAGITQRSETEQ